MFIELEISEQMLEIIEKNKGVALPSVFTKGTIDENIYNLLLIFLEFLQCFTNSESGKKE